MLSYAVVAALRLCGNELVAWVLQVLILIYSKAFVREGSEWEDMPKRMTHEYHFCPHKRVTGKLKNERNRSFRNLNE